MLFHFKNQHGEVGFAVLTVISVFLWIVTIGVVKGVKKEQQPTIQTQQEQQEEKAKQQ